MAESEPLSTNARRGLLIGAAAVAIGLSVLAIGGGGRSRETDPDSSQRASRSTELDSSVLELAEVDPPVRNRQPLPAIDPAFLPNTAASHLVLTTGLDVEFIDLASGVRTVQPVGGVDVWNAIYPVDGGVVITKSGFDRPVFVPVEGDPVDLTDPSGDLRSWPIGTDGGTVFLQGELNFDGVWYSTISAVTLDGDQLWQRVNPFGLEAAGVTVAGEVIVNAGGRVFAISKNEVREIDVGVVKAVIGNLLLIDSCAPDLTCAIEALDVRDGSRTPVSLDRGRFEHWGGSPSFILWSQNEGPQAYAVLADELVVLDTEPSMANGELGLAVDETGVVAVAHYQRVTITEPSGDELELTFEEVRCCGNGVAIAFASIG